MASHWHLCCCSALQSGELEPGLLARGLEKVLDSGADVREMSHYALLALHSEDPALRRLAAKQVGIATQVVSTLDYGCSLK